MEKEKHYCFRVAYRLWVNDFLGDVKRLSTVAKTHRGAAVNVRLHLLNVKASLNNADIEIEDVQEIEEINC
jgi:hypothetical protein